MGVSSRRNITFSPETTDGGVIIRFSLPESTAGAYEQALSVQLKEKNSSLISLQLEDPVKQKDQDILDQLVREYDH